MTTKTFDESWFRRGHDALCKLEKLLKREYKDGGDRHKCLLSVPDIKLLCRFIENVNDSEVGVTKGYNGGFCLKGPYKKDGTVELFYGVGRDYYVTVFNRNKIIIADEAGIKKNKNWLYMDNGQLAIKVYAIDLWDDPVSGSSRYERFYRNILSFRGKMRTQRIRWFDRGDYIWWYAGINHKKYKKRNKELYNLAKRIYLPN